MDLDILRVFVTVTLFVLFIALCVWAWSDRRRADFEAAARLPFDADDEASGSRQGEEAR
jgi:cytochrome c oxidase cbb3-type subunit 4